MKLNVGCGERKKEGYINLDIGEHGQEVQRDVLRGLPFDDEKFDEVYSSHFLEHIERKDVDFVIREMLRVLKRGGVIVGHVPHTDSQEAYYPCHLSYWNERVIESMPNGGYDIEIVDLRRGDIELHFTLRKK